MSVIKRNGSRYWYTNFIFDGKPVRKSTGTCDRAKAQEWEDRLKAQLWDQKRLGVRPKRLWDEAVIDYLEQMPDGLNKRNTGYTLKKRINPEFCGRALNDITRGDLADFQKKLLRAGLKRSTIDRIVGIVLAILHKAVAWEWIDKAPEIEQLNKGAAPRITYLDKREQQAERLLMELKPHQRRLCIFALETGLRRHNVTHLKWEYVDFERRVATIPRTQVKGETRTITVPLSPLALHLLRTIYAEAENPGIYVFTYRGRPQYQTATRSWRKALARAGIPKGFRWHDLRHTWASWHAQGGTPERILQDLGGWKDRKMVVHYAHLAVEHLVPYVEGHGGLPTGLLALVSDKSSDSASSATQEIDGKPLIRMERETSLELATSTLARRRTPRRT